MTPYPPLVFSLALLLWSWQTGAWIAGAVLALWFEWMQRAGSRWQMTDKNIERLVDLTSLMLLALVVFKYSQGPLSAGIFAALRWSPLLLLPLVSAQLLSARDGIAYRALFLSQRRSRSPEADRLLDLKPVYLGACLLAAGVGTAAGRDGDGLSQFGYLAGLIGFLIWVRAWQLGAAARRQWPQWIMLLMLAGALALIGQHGLVRAQRGLEDWAVTWMTGFFSADEDPWRARTALGDIGTLKLSDRVLYRVTTQAPLTQALLLRTAAYDRYVDTTWLTRERDFVAVDHARDGWQWQPAPAAVDRQQLQIGGYLPRRGQLLPAPIGAWRLSDLPVLHLDRLPLGAIKASDGPPLIHYRAFFSAGAASDRPPDDADLLVPRAERPVLGSLVSQLGLDQGETPEKIRRVRDYFRRDFRYSLELPGPQSGQTAIGHFLTRSHRGHCEFFASATALLLRQAGVPARYAVGYSVQEQAGAPNHYQVRRSHAHAWTLYWRRDRWWNLDTTPALWAELEARQRPFWQPLTDAFSRLWYRFNLSRLEPDQTTPPWVWALLAVLFAVLAYRLRLGQRWTRRQARRRSSKAAAPGGALDPIAAILTRWGWPRRLGETDRQWLTRVQRTRETGLNPETLETVLRLNEGDRYRPGGLCRDEKAELRAMVKLWLANWQTSGRRNP